MLCCVYLATDTQKAFNLFRNVCSCRRQNKSNLLAAIKFCFVIEELIELTMLLWNVKRSVLMCCIRCVSQKRRVDVDLR